jgi:hypothetical protein
MRQGSLWTLPLCFCTRTIKGGSIPYLGVSQMRYCIELENQFLSYLYDLKKPLLTWIAFDTSFTCQISKAGSFGSAFFVQISPEIVFL